MKITNYNKTMVRWNENHFELYSLAFGWCICTLTELELVPKPFQKRCKDNNKVPLTLTGGGSRSTNHDGYKLPLIDKKKIPNI